MICSLRNTFTNRQNPIVAVLTLLISFTTTAVAGWPSMPVRFVAPVVAGGGSDAVLRTIADALQKRWRQPVIVDNRPGSHSALAIRAFLDARDGHTFLFSPSTPVTINHIWFRKLPYDPLTDLVPVTMVVEDFLAIAATPSLQVNSLSELLSVAKKKRGELNYTTAGSTPDLTFLAIQKRAGIEFLYVPYRSMANSIPDLTEGRIHAAVLPLGSVLGQARAGKVKLLAVLNDKRCPAAPDVPALAETGYPDLTHNGMNGVFARRDMPASLRHYVAAEIRAVLNDAGIGERLRTLGYIVHPTSPEEYASSLQKARSHASALAKDLGVRPIQ